MRPEEEFETRCTRAGMAPVSPSRLRIVAAVFQGPELATDEVLQESMASQGIEVSRPTLYRTLDMLTRVGLMARPDPQKRSGCSPMMAGNSVCRRVGFSLPVRLRRAPDQRAQGPRHSDHTAPSRYHWRSSLDS
jgi:Fe2+ or Zn2+ uptake regulation protein